jgi:pyruvate ferredoxin oxidoreductase beta subunit
MSKSNVKPLKVTDIPEEELITTGTRLCAGCGAQLAYRMALKALGLNTIGTVPASCSTVLHGMQGFTAVKIPVLHTCFETTAASASGISASLRSQGLDKKITVLAWAGDGGTADIGIQGLSGAAERGEDFIYCCYDNEAYMNTGTQRSGSTPWGAKTTTTPIIGKTQIKKNMPKILAAHDLSYVATASSGYPKDIYQKFLTAKEMRGQGVRYIQIMSPCPPGWGHNTDESIEIGKLAVETGFWPLFERIHGKLILSKPSQKHLDKSKRKDIRQYLKMQGRFKHFTEDHFKVWEKYIDKVWKEIAFELKMQESLDL